MFSTANETTKTSPAVQQKTAGTTFFRKAGEESFFGTKETSPFFKSSIQAKLTVSTPDDPQEKEADEVADRVMRMQEPIAAAPLPEKNEEKLQRKEEEEIQAKQEAPLVHKIQCKSEPGQKLQAKAASCCCGAKEDSHKHTKPETQKSITSNSSSSSLYASDVMRQSGRGPPTGSVPFEQTLASSKGGGSALPGDTQQFMESRFNSDFSDERIHTDSTAENLSRSVNAQAFAHGNDIYFNSGKFSPDSTEGRTLLAHELTHTVQQGASKSHTSVNANLATKNGTIGNTGSNVLSRLCTNEKSSGKSIVQFKCAHCEKKGEEKLQAKLNTDSPVTTINIESILNPSQVSNSPAPKLFKKQNKSTDTKEDDLTPEVYKTAAEKAEPLKPVAIDKNAVPVTSIVSSVHETPDTNVPVNKDNSRPTEDESTTTELTATKKTHGEGASVITNEAAASGKDRSTRVPGKASVAGAGAVRASTPGELLRSLGTAPYSRFGEAVSAASATIPRLHRDQKTQLAESLPKIQRPTGLPVTKRNGVAAPALPIASASTLEVAWFIRQLSQAGTT